jgi:exonuclease SbcC
MDKAYLIDQLNIALTTLRTGEGTIDTREECPSSEFVVRMPCYAAFFSVVDSSKNLAQIYATAEREISSLMTMKGIELPRDLELVIIVAGDKPPDPGLVRRIADDQHICRKFVFWPNGRRIDEVLAELPFWPPSDLISGTPTSLGAGVQEALGGHDPRLIADLVSHSPGAERIFEKIRDGAYSLTGELSRQEKAIPQQVVQSIQSNLAALDITDFRGIRHLRPEDMQLTGDVIFIYGPNGVGKTSIADAVEWAITGRVSRLEPRHSWSPKGGPDPIVNVFADNGEARVTCYFNNREQIRRIKHGQKTKRSIGSHIAADDRVVIDYVVGTKAPSAEARLRIERLRELFRGSHMLAQHDIRQFLELTGPADRFDILTNMIGAEEFVRFREKVAAVLRHLHSHVGAMAEQSKSLERELGDVSTKLHDRQSDLAKLSRAMTSGISPMDLASELIQGLRKCECTIDEAALARAGGEPAERRLEFIAVYTETLIRGKKASIEDLMVRLNSLEQELKGYIESRARCENLAAEIALAKDDREKTRDSLQMQEKLCQDIKASLRDLITKQLSAKKRYADLIWLRENLSVYNQSWEALRRIEDFLTCQREELRRSEVTLEDQLKSLSNKRTRLVEIEQAIANKRSRKHVLVGLLRRLPYSQAKKREADELDNRERQLSSQVEEIKRKENRALDELNVARAHLDELQVVYNSETGRHDELNSFLARLTELVRSAECPLCGRVFASADEAKDSIQEHLSAVPVQLKSLAHRLDETKKDAEVKQSQADSITKHLRALEAESEKVRSNKAIAIKEVHNFIADCAASDVTIPLEDVASWLIPLEEAQKECSFGLLVSEAASLRDEIKSLASHAMEQQNAVDGMRRIIVQKENEHTQLVTTVQDLEADMVQRGFEKGAILQGDLLSSELSRAQNKLKESGESAAKKEADSRSAELSITGLRENLRKADEDAASKENQLRQHETSYNRFVAACRSVKVDPENPKESIHAAKQKASEMNRFLSTLEKKRQVLQQVASLGRLNLEIDSLARTEDEVKRQTEASSQEESKLRGWESHFEGIEVEAVRRQVDVVGTYLERLEPTTQLLNRRLNPHPTFGDIRFRINEKKHELNIEAEASISCKRLDNIAVSPSAFFSDAQMNSLAITVFLAGALRQRWSGFNTILIDDPVQQMDEMNVYAFLDLIRGLSKQRQFIIFTCSRDFYILALEKLGCLNKSKRGRFLAYRLEGISPAELKVHCDTE